jgi:O-antigen ligase
LGAATLLCVAIALLTLIPSKMIIPQLTDLGRPGLLVGFVLFCWWILARFARQLSLPGPQPMRWAVAFFLVSAIGSYAVAFNRVLSDIELNGADRILLFYMVLAGLTLTAADGIPDWQRLQMVLRVLVGCGAFMAVVAIIQFVFVLDVTKYMVIPGLAPKGVQPGFEARGYQLRVAATTTHYIELAACLATMLPFAIHFAIFYEKAKQKRSALVFALLIAAGIGTTISRTGIFAIILMALVMFWVWTWRMRFNLAVMTMGLMAVLIVVSPSMVRTLRGLFDDPSNNPAFTVRAERYPLVYRYFVETPWLGRGTGTWIAPQYQILDNQWLATLMSNGIVGVVALGGLYITGIVLGFLAWRRAVSHADRHLCAALVATQVIAIGVGGTFDALSFSTYAAILSVTTGLCATVWRLTHPRREVRTSTPGQEVEPAAPGQEMVRVASR